MALKQQPSLDAAKRIAKGSDLTDLTSKPFIWLHQPSLSNAVMRLNSAVDFNEKSAGYKQKKAAADRHVKTFSFAKNADIYKLLTLVPEERDINGGDVCIVDVRSTAENKFALAGLDGGYGAFVNGLAAAILIIAEQGGEQTMESVLSSALLGKNGTAAAYGLAYAQNGSQLMVALPDAGRTEITKYLLSSKDLEMSVINLLKPYTLCAVMARRTAMIKGISFAGQHWNDSDAIMGYIKRIALGEEEPPAEDENEINTVAVDEPLTGEEDDLSDSVNTEDEARLIGIYENTSYLRLALPGVDITSGTVPADTELYEIESGADYEGYALEWNGNDFNVLTFGGACRLTEANELYDIVINKPDESSAYTDELSEPASVAEDDDEDDSDVTGDEGDAYPFISDAEDLDGIADNMGDSCPVTEALADIETEIAAEWDTSTGEELVIDDADSKEDGTEFTSNDDIKQEQTVNLSAEPIPNGSEYIEQSEPPVDAVACTLSNLNTFEIPEANSFDIANVKDIRLPFVQFISALEDVTESSPGVTDLLFRVSEVKPRKEALLPEEIAYIMRDEGFDAVDAECARATAESIRETELSLEEAASAIARALFGGRGTGTRLGWAKRVIDGSAVVSSVRYIKADIAVAVLRDVRMSEDAIGSLFAKLANELNFDRQDIYR